jgi:xylan 1,4-beta-xylosidase
MPAQQPMGPAQHGDQAARAWRERIGEPSDLDQATTPAGPELTAPGGARATPGRGQVTLCWDLVPGATGYLIHRAADPDGPFRPLDHGGGDVLAVASPPYADTEPAPSGTTWCYAVAAIAGPATIGPLSRPVPGHRAAPATEVAEAAVRVQVGSEVTGELDRPWQPMIGAEHLSLLLSTGRTGGRVVGAELSQALSIAATELGVRAVRAHGICGDDLGLYTEPGGQPRYDFSAVDQVYDELLRLGLRPVVELSFMPWALARDPGATVFSYGAVISPPRDWSRWASLVERFTAHLVSRYGLAEVRDHWAFEVWNEPNLAVFWSGSQAEYFRLYDLTARAVTAVHPGLRVGGPGSAAAGWAEEFLAHLDEAGAPASFLSTHVYGTVPPDLRPVLARHSRAGLPLWWTEWGVTPLHHNPVTDTPFAAAFLLRGMRSAAGRVAALSHWVVSDHFEELGPPPRLFHGGFGLLSVGNLRKPTFWALRLLNRLGPRQLAVSVTGDGAWSIVEAVAATAPAGRIGVLIWNGTLSQHPVPDPGPLTREITLHLEVAPGDSYTVRHYRIDAGHSNIAAVWAGLAGGRDWPTDQEWATLAAANVLAEWEPPGRHHGADGPLRRWFPLPQPGVSYLELAPDRAARAPGPDA